MKTFYIVAKFLFLLAVQNVFVGTAFAESTQAPWRSPQTTFLPSVQTGGQITCSLLNNTGSTITITNPVIRVRGIFGESIVSNGHGSSRDVEDGETYGYTTGTLNQLFNPVYCEIDSRTTFSTADENIIFTITVTDQNGKVTLVAPPRRKG